MTFKELRKSKKITQRELAIRIGTEPASVSTWDNGKVTPKTETMHRIAAALRCTYDEVAACFPNGLSGLALLRARKCMTQVDLAIAMDVKPNTVSSWERGAAIPDLTTVARMSEVFECTFVEVAECFVKVRK